MIKQGKHIKLTYRPKETTDYKMSFMRALKAKESEFEIAKCYYDNTHIVKHNGRVFVVMSFGDLYSFCEDSLIHADMADDVPYAAIIDIAEDVHLWPEFYLEVSIGLNKDQKKILIEAIAVSDGNIGLFWEIIRDACDTDFIYGECVVAMANVFDFECCVDELVGFYQSYGDEFLCELRNGIFDSVDISETADDSNDDGVFYVYEVDKMHWKINQDGLKKVESKKKTISKISQK